VSELKTAVPLCVDLDGTIISSDVIWESLVRLLKRNPLYLILVLIWWTRGRAYLKGQVAERVHLDVGSLPYNEPVLDFLRSQKRAGRTIILATASDSKPAQQVANHLGLFDEVIASDRETNIRGKDKGALLAKRFGARGFDYAGNSMVDLAVWAQAREAIVVSGNPGLMARAAERAPVVYTFGGPNTSVAFLKALRPHQWVKNLILFVPVLTAHMLLRPQILQQAVLAFVAFSLCASGVYVLNDLLDIDADRHHPTRRSRPFASGELPLPAGLVAFPLLFVASAVLATRLPAGFGAVLGLYVMVTTSYSLRLKETPLLDVFCLAGLYTIRLIAGHEATGIRYSFWLLLFAMFIFLSLALVKRFTELISARQQNRSDIKGRGYVASDLELVATLGASSGYLAVLVLALYVNSLEVTKLYINPMWLLWICPLLLFWISRVWLLAHRGQMHDDPIIFAIKDRLSYLVGAITLLILWLATGP